MFLCRSRDEIASRPSVFLFCFSPASKPSPKSYNRIQLQSFTLNTSFSGLHHVMNALFGTAFSISASEISHAGGAQLRLGAKTRILKLPFQLQFHSSPSLLSPESPKSSLVSPLTFSPTCFVSCCVELVASAPQCHSCCFDVKALACRLYP